MPSENHSSQLIDPSAVTGIRAKIARAQSQFDDVGKQIDAYWNRTPITTTSRFNENATEYVAHLRVVEPPAVEWAVIFGEAVHNLRSALDHAVYQVTIAHSGEPLERTGFPIFIDKARFEETGRYQIRGLHPEAQAYVERFQPFNDPEPEDSILWTLHEDWNQDKHRIIQLMTAITTDTNADLDPPVQARIEVYNGIKEDGAKIARITFPEPSRHVKVKFRLGITIVDKNRRDSNLDVTITYQQALDHVVKIVNGLLLMVI